MHITSSSYPLSLSRPIIVSQNTHIVILHFHSFGLSTHSSTDSIPAIFLSLRNCGRSGSLTPSLSRRVVLPVLEFMCCLLLTRAISVVVAWDYAVAVTARSRELHHVVLRPCSKMSNGHQRDGHPTRYVSLRSWGEGTLASTARSHALGLKAHHSGCNGIASTPLWTILNLKSCSRGSADTTSRGEPSESVAPVQKTSAEAAARGQTMESRFSGPACSDQRTCSPA